MCLNSITILYTFTLVVNSKFFKRNLPRKCKLLSKQSHSSFSFNLLFLNPLNLAMYVHQLLRHNLISWSLICEHGIILLENSFTTAVFSRKILSIFQTFRNNTFDKISPIFKVFMVLEMTGSITNLCYCTLSNAPYEPI